MMIYMYLLGTMGQMLLGLDGLWLEIEPRLEYNEFE